ncbi:Fic family protein [Candidatus Saccharibacteria bacterium]|nr:Fic family protein [Candidatus Saccharibacteria bacterium]MCB9817803.1 Fic family protein [Candidatus Nomurabacteria bacterium]
MSNEIVSHKDNRAEDITEFFNSQEQLKDSTQRRDYFEHLDENEFLDLVQQTAGLVRTGKVENQHFDGETVGLMTHEVPDQREKEQLLRDTWTVAKEFLSDAEIPDEDALDYAALTVAGGLLYAHPFMDGNGRTSRTLSYMIARGNGDKQELHDILAETGGGRNWQVAPVPLVTSGQSVFEGKQPKSIEWEDTFVGEAEDALGGAIANSRYKDAIIRKFIEKYGELAGEQIKGSSLQHEDGTSTLNGEEFIAKLVNDPEAGMTNADELMKLHREARADYVHRFLKAMQLKEKTQLRRIRQGDFEITDQDDEFQRGRKQTIIKEFGKRSVNGLLTPAEQQLVQHRSYSRIRHGKERDEDIAA